MTNDFAADVLNILQKRNVTMYGCKPSHLTIFLNGQCKMHFQGERKGKEWSGGITVGVQGLDQQVAMGHSQVVAEVIEKMIDENRIRYDF